MRALTCCLIFVLSPVIAGASGQVVDLAVLLKEPSLPLMESKAPAGSLQERFQILSAAIDRLCKDHTIPPQNGTLPENKGLDLACLWPAVTRELGDTMKALALNSPDQNRLFLTLASRLQPADFYEPQTVAGQAVGFDALFARFVIAHRLVRDTWPAVELVLRRQGLFQEPSDRFIEPWLTSMTPWSFMLQAMRRFSCTAPAAGFDECRLKKDLAAALRHSLRVLDEDESLAQLSRLSAEDFLLSNGFSGAPTALESAAEKDGDAAMAELIRGVLEGRSQKYLFFVADNADDSGLSLQIRRYLAFLAADSARPLETVSNPGDGFCRQAEVILNELGRTIPCRENEARGLFALKLQESGDLYRFNFRHLRSTMAYLAKANRRLSRERVTFKQRERALRDVIDVVTTLRSLNLNTQSALSVDETRPTWRPLMIFIYDMLEGAER